MEALSRALLVPLATLFDPTPAFEDDFQVVRRIDAQSVSETRGWSAALLCQIPSGGDLEVYHLALAGGTSRTVSTHNFGVSEMVIATIGTLRIETTRTQAELQAGDVASFSANIERTYSAVGGDCEFLLLNRYADTERIVNMRIQRHARGQV